MGLFQKTVETYDAMQELAGVKVEGKEILAPIGHIITRAAIEITIDKDGDFINAVKIDEKIPIPATEKSSGRTSGSVPHPLCDNLEYISGIDKEKYNLYIEGLHSWNSSKQGTAKTNAIYQYVIKNNVLADLTKCNLVETDNNGNTKNIKDVITWRVIGIGEDSGTVYEDRNLQKLFYEYYVQQKENEDWCMITGKKMPIASQHIKGIYSKSGNAKVISANDNNNYTYRGRFKDATEALSISYESSQKALNALKWLLSNEGISCGNRVMVCWNPNGAQVPEITKPLLFDDNKKVKMSECADNLKDAIYGCKNKLPDNDFVIVAAFEAATSGRLSVTYYSELKYSDFLERLKYWDETCCWYSCTPHL